jgi:hypothetical protein
MCQPRTFQIAHAPRCNTTNKCNNYLTKRKIYVVIMSIKVRNVWTSLLFGHTLIIPSISSKAIAMCQWRLNTYSGGILYQISSCVGKSMRPYERTVYDSITIT